MTILKTMQLRRCFGPLVAVDSLGIEIKQGEVFGLLGPNGAGKTTVIKMLTTLLPPTSGRAEVSGFDIVCEARKVRGVIGYVPQMLSADGALSGYENLLVFARLYDVPRAERARRIQESLEFMQLTEAADRLVRTYSGGMIRRLEIAQSVMHHPRMLFLDEPTIGLDPVARQAVWDHVSQLRQEFGITILLTTHYMEEADNLCDRIAIMHAGKVVVTGTPEELKSSINGGSATLDQVFAHYTGNSLNTPESGGNFRETSRTRRNARRLG